jgi:hypothetical protein
MLRILPGFYMNADFRAAMRRQGFPRRAAKLAKG